ncbi:ABC transporter permease subunit [Methanobrevibacter sp.]|uniref:ABC transporter permease subunit n=1 Tax=Methanobrevibacter sp. TaxID=66852 RepID=UPI0025DAE492|nr:ABC transporter permease subunit [Methanobrevibacter sp.]MBQ2665195.1 ABC transporter permease subunit [Methanobrevibacter sp.]
MFSIRYFSYLVKSNFKFLAAFTLVLCAFLIVMCNVFTPETISGISNTTKGTIASNILTGNGTLIGFMSNSFYALMAIIFPMVYSIVVANRMIAEPVDRGSMASFLSTPMSRHKLTITSALYLILSLMVMWGVATIVGITAANAFQPDALDVDTFLMLNLGVFLYHFAISSISFCSSCIFNTSKNSLLIGGGLPLMFFVISLFIKLSDSLEFLEYFTLNTLFNPSNIVNNSGYSQEFMIMALIGIILYIIGIIWFERKDLPL